MVVCMGGQSSAHGGVLRRLRKLTIEHGPARDRRQKLKGVGVDYGRKEARGGKRRDGEVLYQRLDEEHIHGGGAIMASKYTGERASEKVSAGFPVAGWSSSHREGSERTMRRWGTPGASSAPAGVRLAFIGAKELGTRCHDVHRVEEGCRNGHVERSLLGRCGRRGTPLVSVTWRAGDGRA